MLRGFDVSFLTDWAALQAQHGISFGVARCMREFEQKDATFDANWQRMGALDNFVRMAYTFASPALGTDAVDDARLYWQYITTAGPPRPTDYFWLDLEKSALSQEDTNDWAEAWFDEFILISGYRPGIYNGGYLMNRTGIGLNERFGRLWYPRPETQYSDSWPTTFSPKLPIGASSWTDTNWGRKPDFWQSSFWFTFNGVDHDADLFDGTLEQLQALNKEPPMTTAEQDALIKRFLDTQLTRIKPVTRPDGTIDDKISVRDCLRWSYHRSTEADLVLPTAIPQDPSSLVPDAAEVEAIVARHVDPLRALLPGE
jgi:GH25 family lysozyme M1 (1,4-beta-N-acetylmuramidase)